MAKFDMYFDNAVAPKKIYDFFAGFHDRPDPVTFMGAPIELGEYVPENRIILRVGNNVVGQIVLPEDKDNG